MNSFKNKNTKILILGLSGSGKSTVASNLAKNYGLKLLEADNLVMETNGGIWPEGDDQFIDGVFEKANVEALKMDKVIYVISWLTPERIRDFYEAGFVIFEMHADFDELLRRKELRDGMNKKRKDRFIKTYAGYSQSILATEMQKYYKKSIDTTNLSSGVIYKLITESLNN